MPDPIFADPALAALYDHVDDDRSDLGVYTAIVDELEADSVLDVGCGTGTFACSLALAGKRVVALDPAKASLDIARDKPGAEQVRWIHGDVASLPDLEVDLAVMTGNVAMVFLDDDDWELVLAALHGTISDGGWIVFESRNPTRRAWEHWTKNETYRTVDTTTSGRVDTWIDLVEVRPPNVSFRHTFRFHRDGQEMTSDSTLRFRTADEIIDSLDRTGFTLRDVRDALDRPGLEHVYLAQRRPGRAERWDGPDLVPAHLRDLGAKPPPKQGASSFPPAVCRPR